MDYFQGVVYDYLRADRAVFINTETCLSLDRGKELPGRHWYCDAVAVNLRSSEVLLCEVSFATGLQALLARLASWADNWDGVKMALRRDCNVLESFAVHPWVFIREEAVSEFIRRLERFWNSDLLGHPYITTLECTLPWKYRSWDRTQSNEQVCEAVPPAYRPFRKVSAGPAVEAPGV